MQFCIIRDRIPTFKSSEELSANLLSEEKACFYELGGHRQVKVPSRLSFLASFLNPQALKFYLVRGVEGVLGLD